jgi:hypothetical protein
VVDLAAAGAEPAAGEAADDLIVGGGDVEGEGDGNAAARERVVEGPGLLDRARKAIEEDTLLGIGPLDAFEQHRDRDFVRHQLAQIHELLGALAQLGALLDGLAEQIAGGDVREPEPVGDELRLRAFAGARRAKQHEEEAVTVARAHRDGGASG